MSILLISDSKGFGGVSQATENLSQAFSDSNLTNSILYINSNPVKILYNLREYSTSLSRYDICIFMHFSAIFLGLFLCYFTRKLKLKKQVYVIHTDLVGYYEHSNHIKRIILRVIVYLLRNKSIVFTSQEAESRAKFKFKFRYTTTIYNVVNLDAQNKGNDRNKETAFILGSVSRLHKSKNVDLLIKVFARLVILNPQLNVRLSIYGDGKEFESLNNYCQMLGMQEKIMFYGYEHNIDNIYPNIDGLVSFSSLEGFGLTILESLKYGKPVLHTNCHCGPTELLIPCSNSVIKINNDYIHTLYGFLINIKDVGFPYRFESTEHEESYYIGLKDFVEYYQSHKIDEYDFTKFDGSNIVLSWLKIIGECQNV